jgi:hypothetical protein
VRYTTTCFTYILHAHCVCLVDVMEGTSNRTITDWNQISDGEIGALTGNTYSCRKRVRKVLISVAK